MSHLSGGKSLPNAPHGLEALVSLPLFLITEMFCGQVKSLGKTAGKNWLSSQTGLWEVLESSFLIF